MGLFHTLMTKIFSHADASVPAAGGGGTTTAAATSAPAGGTAPAAAPQRSSAPGAAPAASAPVAAPAPSPGAGTAPAQSVDVAATLDALAKKNSEDLDWKHSIVDLMKLVGMDSSLSARKELAQDLHYTGDTSDSAAMNMWLHKEVMRKLSENGAKIPQDLLKK